MSKTSRGILTTEERLRYLSIPENMNDDIMATYFTLSLQDLEIINRHRGNHNRLGFALQISILRYTGWSLTNIKYIPENILRYISKQLGLNIADFEYYGKRDDTIYEHLKEIIEEYKYHQFSSHYYRKTTEFLYPMAMENSNIIYLIDVSIEKLRKDKIILPVISTIERIVWSVKNKTEKRIYKIINASLDEKQKEQMDMMLEAQENKKTPFSWLKEAPGYSSPNTFLKVIEKLEYIRQLNLNIDTKEIPLSRLNRLAKLGSKYEARSLRRFNPDKRYAIMAIYMVDLSQNLIDQAVEINDRQIMTQLSKGKEAQDEIAKKDGKLKNEKFFYLIQCGRVFEKSRNENVDPYVELDAIITWDNFIDLLDSSEKLLRPLDYNHIDLFGKKYSYLRRYLPTFFEKLEFKSTQAGKPLIKAIDTLRELNDTRKRTIPPDTPLDFVPNNWEKYVIDDNGKISRRYYELAAVTEIKKYIRSGDISVVGSKNYKDFDEYLISRQEWAEICKKPIELAVNISFDDYWTERTKTLTDKIEKVSSNIHNLDGISIEEGKIHVHRLDKDTPDEAKSFSKTLYSLLPRINLTDLLMEVSKWTDFDNYFIHSSTGKKPHPDEKPIIMAALIAMGTNIGLKKMANATPEISYKELLNVSQWRMDEDTLTRAQAILVNFHNKLDLSKVWGDGTTSSSDGMRMPVGVSTLKSEYNPHYGFKKGTTFYRFTSDQFSSFHTEPINTNARDAIHVIDGLLHHETNLVIEEHYTDTGGYADQVFGLTHLLGIAFAPRLRDISETNLFVIGKPSEFPKIKSILNGSINKKLIQQNYNDVLRVAYSILKGNVSAELIMSKLNSYERQNKIATALREMGRIEKTIFILEYIYDEAFRRRVHRGLNKSEFVNALARAIFFGKRGEVREKAIKDQLQQATALNILINVINVWNTVYLSEAVKVLDRLGRLDTHLLQHTSPLAWEHINFLGEYTFDNNIPELNTLRPLQLDNLNVLF